MPQASSSIGLHRVISPVGALPQAADRLDPAPELWPDEARLRIERLNLDAASFRQLVQTHRGDGAAIRAAVCELVATRGKLHNPVTGSGGMLIGVVDDVGPDSPLGLAVGQRVATLVSLTLTPLAITDGLADWDGTSEQVPCRGHAILFARSSWAPVPDDLPIELALAVFDVCGAPALVDRLVRARTRPSVAVIGAAGKSGALSLAAARRAGASRLIGVVPNDEEADRLARSGLADQVVQADARNAAGLAGALGAPADLTIVCADTAGCEPGAILTTAPGGTVLFFSMATSFTTAALTAEGLAADVTLLIGNGYTPGHAELALDLVRTHPSLADLLENHLNLQSKVRL